MWVSYRNEGQCEVLCPTQPGGQTFHSLRSTGRRSMSLYVLRRAHLGPLNRSADLLIWLIPPGTGWSPAGSNKRLLAPVSVGYFQCFASPFNSEPCVGATRFKSGPPLFFFFNFSHELDTNSGAHARPDPQRCLHPPSITTIIIITITVEHNIHRKCKLSQNETKKQTNIKGWDSVMNLHICAITLIFLTSNYYLFIYTFLKTQSCFTMTKDRYKHGTYKTVELQNIQRCRKNKTVEQIKIEQCC